MIRNCSELQVGDRVLRKDRRETLKAIEHLPDGVVRLTFETESILVLGRRWIDAEREVKS
jgi:hypothetical protein